MSVPRALHIVTEVAKALDYAHSIEHLGDLAAVWLYRNDKQLKQISYHEGSDECSYTVTVRAL